MLTLRRRTIVHLVCFPLILILGGVPGSGWSQAGDPGERRRPPVPSELQTTDDWNHRLGELLRAAEPVPLIALDEYQIGPEDLLDITVFEAPELNRNLRVSARGEISLPLLGAVKAVGLTPRELEFVLQELLRRTYMKDPHVGVYVREMQSHPVSVLGAVRKPGVYQVRGSRSLLEVLSLAEGLAEDAGDTVLVMRRPASGGMPSSRRDSREAEGEDPTGNVTGQVGERVAGPAAFAEGGQEDSLEINLKQLLETGDPSHNVPIYPGDIVKVTRAGIVYVVGDVNKAGGFVLASNENISVLQALALAEGLKGTAARSQARIIRTDETNGERTEIPLDLSKVLAGRAPDPRLRPNDIVFVPNSTARTALYRAGEAAISIVSGLIVFRR